MDPCQLPVRQPWLAWPAWPGLAFTIMMAGRCRVRISFLRQLVDTMPHSTARISALVPTQPPADMPRPIPTRQCRKTPGIKYPESVMSSLRPGYLRRGSLVRTNRAHITRARIVSLVLFDPAARSMSRNRRANALGKLDDLSRTPNGSSSASRGRKTRRKTGNPSSDRRPWRHLIRRAGLYRSGLKRVDESQIYSLWGRRSHDGQGGSSPLRLRFTTRFGAKVGRPRSKRRPLPIVSWQEPMPTAVALFRTRFIVLTVMALCADVVLCHLQHSRRSPTIRARTSRS